MCKQAIAEKNLSVNGKRYAHRKDKNSTISTYIWRGTIFFRMAHEARRNRTEKNIIQQRHTKMHQLQHAVLPLLSMHRIP